MKMGLLEFTQNAMGETDSDAGQSTCSLCELPLPTLPITDPDIEGEFCCEGCLLVARTVDDLSS